MFPRGKFDSTSQPFRFIGSPAALDLIATSVKLLEQRQQRFGSPCSACMNSSDWLGRTYAAGDRRERRVSPAAKRGPLKVEQMRFKLG